MKIGDTVQLKSGGPLMTVTCIEPAGNGHTVICAWITSAGNPVRERYPEEALRDPVAETDTGIYDAARRLLATVKEERAMDIPHWMIYPVRELNIALEKYDAAKVQS